MSWLRVCPSCGASEKEKQFAGAFCIDCVAKKELFSLKPFIIQLCPNCGRVRKQSDWIEYNNNVLSEILQAKIKSPFDFSLKANFSFEKKFLVASAEMVFIVDGASIFQKKTLSIPLEKKLCEECGRISGQYHEAIIQLRGNRQQIERIAVRIERLLQNNIVKAEEKKEGINFLVLSKRKAFEALSKLGVRYSLAHKLVGVKEGKRVFKTTILIRV